MNERQMTQLRERIRNEGEARHESRIGGEGTDRPYKEHKVIVWFGEFVGTVTRVCEQPSPARWCELTEAAIDKLVEEIEATQKRVADLLEVR